MTHTYTSFIAILLLMRISFRFFSVCYNSNEVCYYLSNRVFMYYVHVSEVIYSLLILSTMKTIQEK